MSVIAKPLTALCDHCGKITDIDFKEKPHPNKMLETYFICDHCDDHTTCFVTDETVRGLQQDKHSLIDANDRVEAQREINERMTTLKRELVGNGVQTQASLQ